MSRIKNSLTINILVFFAFYYICDVKSNVTRNGYGSTRYMVEVDQYKTISKTEEEYLSFMLDFSLKSDPAEPWHSLNFSSPRVHTLARGLAPAILRFGGGSADAGIFYDVTSAEEQKKVIEMNRHATDKDPAFGGIIAFFPQDIDNLYQLARSAGGRLLYDMNIELRYGPQWDATNARNIMNYMIKKNYSDYIDFELGNEPPYKKFIHSFNASGERLGKDFIIFRNILNEFPEFRSSRLVGPDIETPRDGTYDGEQPIIMRDFVKSVKHGISAVTAHHYYFTGPTATIEQFYNLTYFKFLESSLPLLRKAVYESAGGPIDIWIGESADSNKGGTPNVTDSYASGFLWLDKLGLAAREDIKLVARQTFYGHGSTNNYPLLTDNLYPNPDYWTSYVFKKLVGRIVLPISVRMNAPNSMTSQTNGLLRTYAHCTSPRSGYKQGSIVFIVVNINTDNYANVTFPQSSKFDLVRYLMTPSDGGITSRHIKLNGKVMSLINDVTLPQLNPVPVSSDHVAFPPLTYGFVVMTPKTGVMIKNTCIST